MIFQGKELNIDDSDTFIGLRLGDDGPHIVEVVQVQAADLLKISSTHTEDVVAVLARRTLIDALGGNL